MRILLTYKTVNLVKFTIPGGNEPVNPFIYKSLFNLKKIYIY